MCGRYTLTRQEKIADDLQATLGPGVLGHAWWKARYNVAPTQPAPVVTLHDGVRTVVMARWGLVPFWATKPGSKAPLMINARKENLHAKQWFREALAQRRCLVPADGFFEWKHDDPKHPMPIYLHPRSGETIAFAGLWARSKTEGGVEQLSFTIITGPPNELVRRIHDRMPIVLSRDAYAAWLDPTVDGDEAKQLLAIPTDAGWIDEPVSPHVNKAQHDDPQCIEPIANAEAPAKQLSLFDR
jgi:putative SOS response-associated peptidase YedK